MRSDPHQPEKQPEGDLRTPTREWKRLGIANVAGRDAEYYRGESALIRSLPMFQGLRNRYQFAINYRDDTLQNRYRHSLSVSAVAQEIAKRFGLSEASQALSGTIALAHDIGHPPFSHWGEKVIRRRLAEFGSSWNHDACGLRAVTEWSCSKENPAGISLAPETLEGLTKRYWRYDEGLEVSRTNRTLSELPEVVRKIDTAGGGILALPYFNHLEGQIAYQADRLSFNATDVQDGLRVGRFTPEILEQHFPSAFKVYRATLSDYIREYRRATGNAQPDVSIRDTIESDPQLRGQLFERFAEAFAAYQMDDLIKASDARLKNPVNRLENPGDIRQQDGLLVNFSKELNLEFRSFARFCSDHIFKEKTAPLEPIFEAVFDLFATGQLALPLPYGDRFVAAQEPAEKLAIIAEYATRELDDTAVLSLCKRHRFDIYEKHFPGFEQVNYTPMTLQEAYRRISEALSPTMRDGKYVGMPTVHFTEFDFRPESSLAVISTETKYVLPLPKEGETIQIPYDGFKRSGEKFQIGEPIFDYKGRPISGKGVVYFNAEDDQWIAAKTGLTGDNEQFLIINQVNPTQARLCDLKRDTWGNRNAPTNEELKEFLHYAANLHLLDGITDDQQQALRDKLGSLISDGAGPQGLIAILVPFLAEHDMVRAISDEQIRICLQRFDELYQKDQLNDEKKLLEVLNEALGGLKNIYPTYAKYIRSNLPPCETDNSSLAGYRKRSSQHLCRMVYVDHPFELRTWAGNSERAYSGAAVVDRGNGSGGIVQTFRALSSYSHVDGTRLKIEDIPVQKPNISGKFATAHSVQRDVNTTINIIGAGISGIASAVHLINSFRKAGYPDHKLTLNFIDPASEPAGATYNRPDANIVGMANQIGLLGIDHTEGSVEFMNRDPQKWITLDPGLAGVYDPHSGFDKNVIVTHNLYGQVVKEYFFAFVRELEAENFPIEINFIQDMVVSSDGLALLLKSGGEIKGDAVIYCVGNALPRPVYSMEGNGKKIDGENGYYRLDDQAWALGNINDTGDTVILGTANGALFGALWAVGNGYTGHFKLVSKSGTVPELYGDPVPYERRVITVENLNALRETGVEITAQLLKRLFYRELKVAREQGNSWRDVVDSFAPETSAIWRMLSPAEQRIFHRSYGSQWNNARYRIPNEHWKQIVTLMEAGRLELIGNLEGVRKSRDGFEVHIKEAGGAATVISTTKIVNNTGPSKSIGEMPVCIQSLVANGSARLHHIHGLDVDDGFRIVDSDGHSQRGQYAIGPLVAGAHLESITVPAIRANATVVAKTVLQDVVDVRELQYRSELRELRERLAAPERAEVQMFVQNQIRDGYTGDPRDPNDPSLIPTSKIYGLGVDKNGNRVYTEEREALHRSIIDSAINGKTHASQREQPAFVCVAGGMSVGMTYMQRLLMNEKILGFDDTVVITPLIFREMHEFRIRDHYQHPEKSPLIVEEYYDVVRELVKEAVARGLNVVLVDQADDKQAILDCVQTAKAGGHETALLALTMTPEAYHRASELWLHKFGRIPDHRRGFGDLKEFAENWDEYTRTFELTALYESVFHVEDIDKSLDDPTRREYAVRRLETTVNDGGTDIRRVPGDHARFYDFKERGRYINPDSTTPAEARRDFPYEEFEQLTADVNSDDSAGLDPLQYREGSLTRDLFTFMSGNFQEKFVALVRKTSAERAKRQQKFK